MPMVRRVRWPCDSHSQVRRRVATTRSATIAIAFSSGSRSHSVPYGRR
jgi:hypothetical protein